MDPATFITLVVGIPGFVSLGLWFVSYRSRRQELERRYAWERQLEVQQEQRSLLLNQPDLEPVGASLHTDDEPARLLVGDDQSISIHNAGGTIPTEVYGVLFPTQKYVESAMRLTFHMPGIEGTYWQGKMDVGPGSSNQIAFVLKAAKNPLRGDMSVIEGIPLYAPPEPDMGEVLAGDATFYFARLTLTYRDCFGRRLATVFDLAALRNEWHRVAGPIVVEHDLPELTAQAALALRPPVFARDVLPALNEQTTQRQPDTSIVVPGKYELLRG
jgi:hypothetical protein